MQNTKGISPRERFSCLRAGAAVVAGLVVLMAAPASGQIASGLAGASGSTVGPDGMLYVTEGMDGRISRIDPDTGAKSPFTEGLPKWQIGVGGVVDVEFFGGTAYALVTVVEEIPALGVFTSTGHSGIYRIDGPNSQTLIADIGQFSLDNPSESEVFVLTGVHYAMAKYRNGFLVTDGHHNRILWVSRQGRISVFAAFDNVVPTGLEVHGNRVYVSLVGPAPHNPEDAKILTLTSQNVGGQDVVAGEVIEVAGGDDAVVAMMVDVEFGPGRGKVLYGLAQGIWDGLFPGSPAIASTGSLVRVGRNGNLELLATGLDRPTSVEFIGDNAFVVSLSGDVFKVPIE